jgi:hypothetical protein
MSAEKMTTKKHVGYMDASYGDKRCDNCEYYPAKGECNNKVVIGWAEEGKWNLKMLPNGNAKVDPAGCSDEFWPKDMA